MVEFYREALVFSSEFFLYREFVNNDTFSEMGDLDILLKGMTGLV